MVAKGIDFYNDTDDVIKAKQEYLDALKWIKFILSKTIQKLIYK